MNQIFICSPPEIEEFARETYSGEAGLHAWAYPEVMEIVRDRGGKTIDIPLRANRQTSPSRPWKRLWR